MKKINLLLLSGTSLVGRNIIQSLENSRHSFYLTVFTSDPYEVDLEDFDEIYLVESTFNNHVELMAKLLSVVRTNSIDLIVPCRDDDVLFLAAFKDLYK